MKTITTILTTLTATFFLTGCGAPTVPTNKIWTDEMIDTGDVVVEIPKPKIGWRYNTEVDKMTNDKRYFASCTSTNTLYFAFPYDGGSTCDIMLRQMGKGNEVLFTVSKGQFLMSIGGQKGMRIKFDDEKPITFSYNSASDASTDVIFINSPKKFIDKLKKAKKVIIESEFAFAGLHQLEFDVDGLQWDK